MSSLAVVVLDTLRADAFRRHFDWLPGRHFRRTYAPSHWTVPVHASLFTGLYPAEVGVHGRSPSLDCPDAVLAERLRAAGHRTRCYTANPQLVQYPGWDRGFETFVGYGNLDAHRPDDFDWRAALDASDAGGARGYAGAVWRCLREDCATLRSLRRGLALYRRSAADGGAPAVLERVRATGYGDDEFLFVNLMETHTPYHPPEAGGDPVTAVAADAFADEPLDLDRLERAYDASARHLAEVYRDLFDELSGAFDHVVTVSDHGELLGEHGLVNHSFGLHPELVRVPLVVSGPAVEDGTDDRVANLLDLHRTVGELLGVDVGGRGHSLLAAPAPTDRLVRYHGPLPFHEAQFERAGVPLEVLRRRSAPLAGVVTAAGGYAYETHERGLQVEGAVDGDPRERIDELAASLDERAVAVEGVSVDDATRERLEDLGYA